MTNVTEEKQKPLSLERDWVLGDAGGIRVLGHLEVDDTFGPQGEGTLKQQVESNLVLRLSPAYEILRVEAGPGNFGLIAIPYSLLAHTTPLYIRLHGAMLLSEMHQDDRDTFKALIKMAEAYKTGMRANRAGLVTPDGSPHAPRRT